MEACQPMTRCASLILLISLSNLLFGQELIQDWSQSTKTFDQEDPGTIKVTITGVNPFLYAYATEWTAQDQALSDFNVIVKYLPNNAVVKNMAAEAASSCDQMVKDVKDAIQKNLAPKGTSSIALADTQKAWSQYVSDKYT